MMMNLTETTMMHAVGDALAKILEDEGLQIEAASNAWDDLCAAHPKLGADREDDQKTMDRLSDGSANLATAIAKLLRTREGRAKLVALAAEVK
jgi:predicted class III extradiol MEMO1 family dioxygenase